MNKQFHPFHMVESSPWPLTGAMSGLLLTLGLVKMFHSSEMFLLNLGLMAVTLTVVFWWRDISRESTFQGWHSKKVTSSMKLGMILFILSEVLFFFSFFWAFFHSSLSPSIDIGLMWPPKGVNSINPFSVPFLGTIILLSSGATITWSHNSILNNKFQESYMSILFTIILGMMFTYLQGKEYYETSFNISDSVYSSTFFVATGFHGLHVIIGSIFLFISFLRMFYKQISFYHHVGFEAAAWYWHFVDVVWLFLFISLYWWSY